MCSAVAWPQPEDEEDALILGTPRSIYPAEARYIFELRGKRLEVLAGRDGEFLRIDIDYDGAESAHQFQVEKIEANELFPCAASVMARDGLAFERDGLFTLFVNFARNGERFPRQLESIGCTDSVALITIVFHGDGPVEEGGHIRLIDRD